MGLIYKSILIFLLSFSALFAQEKHYLNQEEAVEVRFYLDKMTVKQDTINLYSEYKDYLQNMCVQYVKESKPDSAQICVDLIAKLEPKITDLSTEYSILRTSLSNTIDTLHQKYNLPVEQYKVEVEWTKFGGVYFFVEKDK